MDEITGFKDVAPYLTQPLVLVEIEQTLRLACGNGFRARALSRDQRGVAARQVRTDVIGDLRCIFRPVGGPPTTMPHREHRIHYRFYRRWLDDAGASARPPRLPGSDSFHSAVARFMDFESQHTRSGIAVAEDTGPVIHAKVPNGLDASQSAA